MTERLPIFPLRTVLLPGDLLPLHIFEPRYRLMLSRCGEKEPCFGVVLTRSGSEVGDQPEIYAIGTSAITVERVAMPDGRSNLLVKGARRFEVVESDWEFSYMVATVRWLDAPDEGVAHAGLHGRVGRLKNLLVRYLDAYNQVTGHRASLRDFHDDPVAFAYAVASALPMPLEAKQRLLEAAPPEALLSELEETVRHETALLARTGAYATLPGHPGTGFTRN